MNQFLQAPSIPQAPGLFKAPIPQSSGSLTNQNSPIARNLPHSLFQRAKTQKILDSLMHTSGEGGGVVIFSSKYR